MAEWAKANLTPGQTFSKTAPLSWFAEHYSKIKPQTVRMHVDGMSVNNPVRRHHPSIRPGSNYDLFFKLGPDQYRLWMPETDPPARYKEDIEKELAEGVNREETESELEYVAPGEGASEFAFEKDLQNYLVKNLSLIEPGLKLYEEEGISGVEFPVGGRFIDILAIDREEQFVVVELKVSRGYDRVIGQLLRYMGWIEANMDTAKAVRGIIVAKEITNDLKLAASRISGVRLVEYEISFKLNAVT